MWYTPPDGRPRIKSTALARGMRAYASLPGIRRSRAAALAKVGGEFIV